MKETTWVSLHKKTLTDRSEVFNILILQDTIYQDKSEDHQSISIPCPDLESGIDVVNAFRKAGIPTIVCL